MSLKVWINGELVDKENAKVSVYDHGLLYGDGVFEGIRLYHGKVFKFDEHIDRLYDSARFVMINIPLSKEEMKKAVESTVKANQLESAYIRLVVTRGPGDLGIDPRKCKVATVFIIADKIQLYPEEMYQTGLRVITVPTPRNPAECINPRVKSLNYMNNILARLEGNNVGVPEVVMLNTNGTVCEGSADNLFIVRKGIVKTPPPTDGILEGVTRNTVIEIARKAGYPMLECSLQRYDLYNADEFFFTGTGAELIPVINCDGRTIGTGKPGPIFQDLLMRFRELTKTGG